ncbi:hypothetical protein GHT06_010658 [Daphnia sinensis]|uniref:DEUBAD domain-containing protein n=1 Tax=Daphnia sinensis TaxID=1820382 RepID=A0AAD5LI71_9CRUS|nr:hypothetical protein GHT06_010658 [Daphnia sinensis]
MDPLFEDESMDVLSQENGLVDTPFENQHSHYIQPLLETCSIDGEAVVLPTQICENASVLTEMLSSELLSDVLTLEDMQHLHSYLPAFKTDMENERHKTWNMLFSKKNFMFGNPVEHFSKKMECGLYNPDIAQTRNLFQKLQKKNIKREQRNYYFNLLQSVVMSRQQLIEAASQLPPGQAVRLQPSQGNNRMSAGGKTNNFLTDERVRKRYFDELKAIDCRTSDDDNYPEGPPPPLSKKQRRHLGSIQGSLSCDIKPIQSTFTQNIYNHLIVVENKLDKTVEDEASRSKAPCSGNELFTGKLSVDSCSRKPCDAKRFGEDFKPVLDVASRVSCSKNVYEVNEETYKIMLSKHRSLKREGKLGLEKSFKDTTLEDIGQRVRMCILNKRPPAPKILESPKKNKPLVSASSSSDEQDSEPDTPKKVKVKKPVSGSATKPTKTKNPKSRPDRTESVSATFEQGERSTTTIISEAEVKQEATETPRPITPPPIEKCPTPPPPPPPLPPPPPPSLTQDTHSSFFTLLREVLINNELPATLKQTTDSVVVWSTSPISPLNEWYSQLMLVHQRANGWTSLVQSALEFLMDHGLVSVAQDLGQLPVHSWSGQGRDSDALLQDLSGIWLQQQQDNSLDGKLDVEGTSELNDSMLSSPPDPTLNLGSGLDLSEDISDVGSSSLFDSADVVHPPRSVTSWTVKPSTAEDKMIYQEQERLRYCQPHKAFTFRQHGYESIVGPVKGVYTPGQGVGQPSSKVRGHNLMVPDRPACVTLLSLVRDAAARLPNGEGTRAEICELMKESQYLASGAEASLHSVVSGALDRLHYEADPCVKYDSARKVWIYLHRHRSESEFEHLHKQHQGMPSRVKKPRSEQRRSSGVGSSPASAKNSKIPPSVPIPATSPVSQPPIIQPTSVPEIQIPVPAPVSVAVMKSTPVKLNNSPIVTVRQELSKSLTAPIVVASPSGSTPTVTTPVTVTGITPSTGAGPATIQTFQITTSSGIQTIRVAAPANLPTALLARTLQISAQQQGALQGQKVIGTSTLVNGNSTIKQVILSPTSAKTTNSTLLSSPRAPVPNVPPTTISVPTSSASSIIRLNIPVTAATVSGIMANTARARFPGSPVRLAGRQVVSTSNSVTSPVQTFLIRPPTPTTASSGNSPSTSSAPRLVMVNNKLINLSSTSIAGQMGPNTRMLRPNIAVNMANVRKAVPSSPTTGAARPVLARVVTGPGGGTQQQVITLENLLSLTNAHHKGGNKTGVVQLPLSAIAGLNVGASSSTNQPTTVLLQNVKGAQSILLPAGFQGGTINIRGVRMATLSQQQQAGQQPKQAFVARLVAPTQPPPPPPKNSDV